MNTERWGQIQHLLEEALDRPEAARRSFLESACGADVDLRDEVISLLAAPVVDELPTAWLGVLASGEPVRFAVGDRVADRYRIRAFLGRGGMGEVYEARDDELEITVALKTLRLAGGSDLALQQLKLEGLLARAVWHPHVCRVYDLGHHSDGAATVWFLTMERLHGVTLAERLRDRGRIPLGCVARLVEQMAAGLGAAHQAGVVHRDFKPGNVMLVDRDGDEQAVVTDFGTARAVRTGMTARSDLAAVVGTPAYMAPEQLRGEEVGPATDVYALGIVLYEMVTGTLPFPGGSSFDIARDRLERNAPSPRSVVPDVDERWEAVISRCLAREPRRRFARAEDVSDALAGRAPAEERAAVDVTPRSRHTLPSERDLFVGRKAEVRDLQHNLTGGSRLITLLGAGGMGKTRLAVRYGWRSLSAWSGGVWFCDLTEARDVNGIVAAVAGSLGIPIGRGDPIEQIGHALAGRGRCLLLLDNFEQVAHHAADTVGRWLVQATDARCVVTSRERLHIDGECVQSVEPLTTDVGMELFEARARGLRPALELVGEEREAAREIVRLVDGMPLAIELAAARMRVMSAAQIAAQMQNRFRLLTGGRDARQETLERTIDGSWDLLAPWEKAAWAHCSVFEEGFTLPAAQAVIDVSPWPNAPSVVDIIQSLVDKSLLRMRGAALRAGEAPPEARFGTYVSLQEYARHRLRELEADAGVRGERTADARHGVWFACYGADDAIEALNRHGGTARRQQLEREIGNVTAACTRALERREAGRAATLYRAAVEVAVLRGPYGATIDLGRDLVAGLQLDPEERAGVLGALGMVERLSGRRDDALSHWEEALDIAREDGDRRIEGGLLGWLGVLHADAGRMDEARAHLEAGLAIHRELGDRVYEGVFTGYLGSTAMDQGHIEEGRARMEVALAIHREVGNRRLEGLVLGNLAKLHRGQGRLEEAMTCNELALAIHRETGDRRSEGVILGQMGNVQFNQGHLDVAVTYYEAAVAIFREVGAKPVEGNYVANLGGVLTSMGRMEDARAHLETALAISREVADPRAEGIALDNLGQLFAVENRLDEARATLAQAEAVFRRVDARTELGNVLCARAEVEWNSGNPAAARGALEEARAIGIQVGAGPDSELGCTLARLGHALGDQA